MSTRSRRLARRKETAERTPAVAVARPRRRGLLSKLARVVGVRRRVVVDGVKYTERSPRKVRPEGGGKKLLVARWEVRFPSGEAMLIHPVDGEGESASAWRIYEDLLPEGSPSPAVHRLLGARVRPGMRAFDAACGTGAGAAWLGTQVGPSGGVVAAGADTESVQYAQRRYGAPHIGFEAGGVETLMGEMPGAFDVVVAARGLGAIDRATAAELWRVVAPGGVLLVEVRGPGGVSDSGGEDEEPGGPGDLDGRSAQGLEASFGVAGEGLGGAAEGVFGLAFVKPREESRRRRDQDDEDGDDGWMFTGDGDEEGGEDE